MRGAERRVAHELADAVEHRDLDFDGNAGDNGGGGVPRGAGDFIAERHAFFGSLGEGLGRGVGGEDAFAEFARAAGLRGETREHAEIDRTPPRMEIEQACASFVILPTPPAMVTRLTGWVRTYLSMPPTKSPMSISAVSGRWCMALTASSRRRRSSPRYGRGAARATSMPL